MRCLSVDVLIILMNLFFVEDKIFQSLDVTDINLLTVLFLCCISGQPGAKFKVMAAKKASKTRVHDGWRSVTFPPPCIFLWCVWQRKWNLWPLWWVSTSALTHGSIQGLDKACLLITVIKRKVKLECIISMLITSQIRFPKVCWSIQFVRFSSQYTGHNFFQVILKFHHLKDVDILQKKAKSWDVKVTNKFKITAISSVPIVRFDVKVDAIFQLFSHR